MKERLWLSSGEPQGLLNLIEGKVSDRKLRLFACACCLRNWIFTEPACEEVVATAARFADGWATGEELNEARLRAADLIGDDPFVAHAFGLEAVAAVAMMPAVEAARATLRAAMTSVRQNISYADIPGFDAHQAETEAVRGELWDQCELLRHIIGNPFRPVAIDPAWLRWNDGTVVKMAQAIYDENRFADLPVLADALQDAGCDNEEILIHCRTPMEHPRGCWVVDALLRKV
jgi:hypothetical protein